MEHERFRGLSGEVVVAFLSFGTLISAIPVLVLYGLALLIGAFAIPDSAYFLRPLLLVAATAFATARFALPAVRGELDSGWINDNVSYAEAGAFALRYLLLMLAWGVLAALLVWLGMQLAGESMMMMGMMGPPSPAALGVGAVPLLLALFIALVAPTLSLIACSATDDLRGAFSPDIWRWLLQEQVGNVMVFYAAMVGGFFVFFLLFALPLLMVTGLLSALSPGLGVALGGFVMLIPLATYPILAGRLAGALVAGETEDELHEEASFIREEDRSAAAPTSSKQPPQAMPDDQAETAAPHTADRAVQEKLIQQVEGTEPLHMENAILLANNRLNARPGDPVAAAGLVLLLCKAGRQEELGERAEKAIRINLKADNGLLAAKMFIGLGKARRGLGLHPVEYRKLGEMLRGLRGYLAAALCLVEAVAAYDDEARAEEALIELLREAEGRARKEDVENIARLFRQRFPQSTRLEERPAAAE